MRVTLVEDQVLLREGLAGLFRDAGHDVVGCEGLTNVIKHARASAATLSAVRRNGSLIVTVADDGVGGAAAWPGSGLAGLADRVQAAGGQLVVRSDATGTLLTAELPCG